MACSIGNSSVPTEVRRSSRLIKLLKGNGTMLPDTKGSWGAGIPLFGQPASDFGGIVPLLLVAALASLFLGANMVEIEAIWSLQRRSDRIGPC
jgi:hypothetical protein